MTISLTKTLTQSFIVVGFISSTVFSMAASAQSACKGLDDDTCSANTSCSWVNSYERKDGRKVSGFCRTSTRGKSVSKTKGKASLNATNPVVVGAAGET